MRLLLSFLLASGLLVSLLSVRPAAPAQGSFEEKRAIFDEGIGWTTKEGADRTLKRIRDAGFNVYVPCVWHGRGTSWPSKLAPWDPYLKERPKAGDDPLHYLIGKAHEMGIEVHPWFTVALRQSDLFPEFAESGTPDEAFDVHSERFRRWIAAVIAEVVARYAVDGVNLDYVRAKGLCVSESCKRDYARRYARNFDADRAVFFLKPGLVPTMVEWQEAAVHALVKTIAETVRGIKPGILISADVAPDVLSLDQGQNSIVWANQGLVDVLFRMDYDRAIAVKRTDSLRGRLNNPEALTLLVSNTERVNRRIVSRDGPWLAGTVTAIESRWPRTGIGIYLFSMLSDEQIGALKAGPFRVQAPGRGRR